MITITVSDGTNEVSRIYTENADFDGAIESMLETLRNSK